MLGVPQWKFELCHLGYGWVLQDHFVERSTLFGKVYHNLTVESIKTMIGNGNTIPMDTIVGIVVLGFS